MALSFTTTASDAPHRPLCATARFRKALAFSTAIVAATFCLPSSASVVREWNEVALQEVRKSKMGPPVVARALAIAHTCMYDAWAVYDARALGTVFGNRLKRPANERRTANIEAAVSHAAYQCLANLFPAGVPRLKAAMVARGYNPDEPTTDPTSPTGIGRTVAQAVIDARRNDGSNQYGDLAPGAYSDYTGYAPRNAPMGHCEPAMVSCPPLMVNDPKTWQPLINNAGALQKFIAPHWERVRPFALTSGTQLDNHPAVARGPGIQGNLALTYRLYVAEALLYSAALTPRQKLIVEYWADGPESELPPGHWALFAQFVSQRDRNSIEKDAKLFFAMHAASFDAGIVAWRQKRKWDGVRPITAVRFLKQGQAVLAWGGPGRGTELIPGEKWVPYNPGSNLTPAFAGYVSGHSTFSWASATMLKLMTGSSRFGYSTVIPPNFGRVEPGVPSVPTTMRYDTFEEAAADAGMSRLYGGIHFSDDNTAGQALGVAVAQMVYAKVKALFNAGDDDEDED